MRNYQWIKWRRFLISLAVIVVLLIFMWAGAPTTWMVGLSLLGIVVNLLYAMAFMIIQFVALFWFLARGRTYWVLPGETGATWDDYRGNPEIVENAKRIVTLLRGVKSFKAMGGEAIRGLLLCGPPGTGKSYLAQVIANEAQVPFAYASAPSFQNMFFGVGNLKVMRIYKKARKLARIYGACIIFIDEVDAIGMKRQGSGGGGGAMGMFGMGGGSGLLNELLLQMDPPNLDSSKIAKLLRQLGLRRKKAERPPVLTIAATNLPDVLDEALLRPGRFDRKLWVDSPDYDGRVDVFNYYLKKVKTDPSFTPEKAALDTVHYSPAQIKHIVNETVVIAHQRGAQLASYEDFRAAMETYEWGLKQPLRSMSADEKRNVAYHEAGHAVAQYLLKPHDRVWKVTIVRRGGALGLAATKPMTERYNRSDSEILAEIQVCLAARAVEEEFLGKKLNGVTSDLQQATQLAGAYLGTVGMGDELFSWLAVGGRVEGFRALRPKINELLKDQMNQVKELVNKHADFVHVIASELLRQEDLTGEEIEEIYVRLYGQLRPEPPTVRHLVKFDKLPDRESAAELEEASERKPEAEEGQSDGGSEEPGDGGPESFESYYLK
ncbi:cell division protease FtsH [Paenibacillus cellulosilyticus]|uniref:Cell division protease FtsH n=1 Tax=Paenibacillus cellulosilyticus TaxID=375489 RepID=A0A2V2YWS3_9BACL|nr:AAA family ATPase [Paenibacillus cellulosilyticus]PWW05206.1 cell division protease FtsH [Paenibacillus cellulosilyticus]QKS43530.1 AAA family ATPase [Paenibacillus cellulosilyticus]